MTTPPPKSRNEVNHEAVHAAVERLRTILGDGCTVVLLACWPDTRDVFESDQIYIGNYFAQEGMVREWLARRKASRHTKEDD